MGIFVSINLDNTTCIITYVCKVTDNNVWHRINANYYEPYR